MYCGKCGNNLEKNAKFCPKCGWRVETKVLNDNTVGNIKLLEVFNSDSLKKMGSLVICAIGSLLTLIGFLLPFYNIVFLVKRGIASYLIDICWVILSLSLVAIVFLRAPKKVLARKSIIPNSAALILMLIYIIYVFSATSGNFIEFASGGVCMLIGTIMGVLGSVFEVVINSKEENTVEPEDKKKRIIIVIVCVVFMIIMAICGVYMAKLDNPLSKLSHLDSNNNDSYVDSTYDSDDTVDSETDVVPDDKNDSESVLPVEAIKGDWKVVKINDSTPKDFADSQEVEESSVVYNIFIKDDDKIIIDDIENGSNTYSITREENGFVVQGYDGSKKYQLKDNKLVLEEYSTEFHKKIIVTLERGSLDLKAIKDAEYNEESESDYNEDDEQYEEEGDVETNTYDNGTSVAANEYLLTDSDTKKITKGDLKYFTAKELTYARNEIYARHGYIFDSKELQDYFSEKDWYVKDSTFGGKLSKLEQKNANFIKSYQDKNGLNYKPK